jgi:DNA modification methylase
VAIAAQADGWWIRSMIVWAKPNPMPESCTDRPTHAYEHILMLTKSERYFWDADAVREPSVNTWRATDLVNPKYGGNDDPIYQIYGHNTFHSDAERSGRNIRNVWTFPTQPFSGAHFATFPEEIPRRCILAATSARGAPARSAAPRGSASRIVTSNSRADRAGQGIRRRERMARITSKREAAITTSAWVR